MKEKLIARPETIERAIAAVSLEMQQTNERELLLSAMRRIRELRILLDQSKVVYDVN